MFSLVKPIYCLYIKSCLVPGSTYPCSGQSIPGYAVIRVLRATCSGHHAKVLSVEEILKCDQSKSTKHYFPVVLLITLYKVVLAFHF